MDFVCIGLDIRQNGTREFVTADATAWYQDEPLYKAAQNELGISENLFQLLQPKDGNTLDALVDMVIASPRSVLVALEIPKLVYEAMPSYAASTNPLNISMYHWSHRGFDVCDINGFFSFLYMSDKYFPEKALFNETNLLSCFEYAQAANLAIPSHRPFVVVGLRTLQKPWLKGSP